MRRRRGCRPARGPRTSAGRSRRIHAATLDVVERIGVRFPSTRAQAIWAEHGATVDRETGIVKAPAALIERALGTAPAAYTLGARDAALDLPLDGAHVHLGTDGCGIEVLDPRDVELPDVGDVILQDTESGVTRELVRRGSAGGS